MVGTTSANPWPNFAQSERAPGFRTDLSDRALAELMHKVSHELRTPLNAVIGFCDLMHQELLGPIGNVRYREYVDHIRDSGADLLKAAEDALVMTALVAAPDVGRDGPCHLATAIREAGDRVAPQAAAAGTAVVARIDAAIEVRADHRALRQALVNIISAAVRIARPGSVIEVDAVADCSTVSLRLSARTKDGASGRNSTERSIAHTLLCLQGHAFVEQTEAGSWETTIALEPVLQSDLFGSG